VGLRIRSVGPKTKRHSLFFTRSAPRGRAPPFSNPGGSEEGEAGKRCASAGREKQGETQARGRAAARRGANARKGGAPPAGVVVGGWCRGF
jgi:hypothetical protein